MRIKDGKGQKKEVLYVAAASVLTVLLLAYLIYLTSHLVQTSQEVFSTDQGTTPAIPGFNFKKYDQVVGGILGVSSTQAGTSTQ